MPPGEFSHPNIPGKAEVLPAAPLNIAQEMSNRVSTMNSIAPAIGPNLIGSVIAIGGITLLVGDSIRKLLGNIYDNTIGNIIPK